MTKTSIGTDPPTQILRPIHRRLTVDDRVRAGFAILAEDGIAALENDRQCDRLAVTKGSFYWHFTDIAGYRTTLIDAWANCATTTAAISVRNPVSRPENGSRK